MSRTVADQFAEILVAAGVKRVYGIVGDSLNGLCDAIRRQDKIEWLHVRHEEVAAFAASAEAHLTGELTVCTGSCGPGNLNLINGLFDCHRSRVPVLAIAAHIPSAEIGSGYFQETHPQDLFGECSHYCELISNPNQMPRVLETAIREAIGNRGVSVLVLPGDVALQPAADAPPSKVAGLLPPMPEIIPTQRDLERLAALLNGDGRITILCGSGCAGAHEELLELASERAERRLTAILAADVAGYSRLMGVDEEGTLKHLKAHRKTLIDPKITEYRGRVVKTTGDGMLVEFASVVDALRCAVEVQRGMAERNAEVPQEQRIEFRIGINVGDIIIDGDDIYGDGVNVAARLEALAEPNGICVSRVVRDQVRDKLDLAFEDMGEQQVKNIARPVRVFRIAAPVIGQPTASAKPALALPGKPSITVLPFTNLSGDPEQDYFADGIVEDIITALSRVRWLFVIARNSSFTYKGKAVDVKQIGRELGVRYVLEGSVRKAGNRVRIAGQLIDAANGAHVWADNFDGALDDIFDLQDRVAASVAGIIEPKLRHAEMERARRKPTESLDAYDLYLRALAQFRGSYEHNREALRLLRRAIEIDPHYAAPYGLAAWCYLIQRARAWASPSDPVLAEGIRMAKLATSLGKDDSETLWMAGHTLAVSGGDLEGGIALIDRALTLNPNSANAWSASGLVRAYLGDTEKAIAHLERSARLSPLDPLGSLRLIGFVFAHFIAGRYDEASAWCDKTLQEQPDYPPALRMKAATCGLLGRLEEGRVWVEHLLAVNPDTTVSGMRLYYGVVMKTPGCLEAFLDGLRKAGLPA